MSGSKTRRIGAFIAFAAMICVNVLASTGQINGQSTEAVSDAYPTLFAPTGSTFAIWGLIYLLLAIYSTYQVMRSNSIIETITNRYIATSVLNILWIFAWQYEVFWLSMVLMVALLVLLIQISQVIAPTRFDFAHTVMLQMPFSLYFGWICIATVANAATLFTSWGFGQGANSVAEAWTVATLITAAVIGIVTMLYNRDFLYGAVFVWAFWGILGNHRPGGTWDGQYQSIIMALWVLLALLAMSCVVAAIFWIRTPKEYVDDVIAA